ncbi:MAG: diaminopimelate epimerase [Deltaproteobacteria bacterium]|jgi:diaminopimelate epimerase|nr:diaminopimelate epimerase [Deltaproteobacteria bacterium]
MNLIPFTKMSAAGNDFIIIDNRQNILDAKKAKECAQNICRRKLSVGADGLILIEDSKKADFKWRFFNADGSEAEMCGNGGRCIARLAHRKGIAPLKLTFETLAGIIKAEVLRESVKLQLPLPLNLTCDLKLLVEEKNFLVNSITVGVPHAVIFVEDLQNCQVVELGKMIRFSKHFKPAGTNVNFVSIKNDSAIAIRTYERGVEDETLACGTGAVASSLIANEKKGVKSPVSVLTRGGEALTVHFTKENQTLKEVFLEGSANLIYEGELYPETLNMA